MNRIFHLLLLAPLLSTCATSIAPEDWPEQAAPHRYFVTAYQEDERNGELQDQDDYLLWVKRFYTGRPGIMGWREITDAVVADMNREQQQTVDRIAETLGRRIAAEWAKDNATRRIDTAMLSLWGSIMVGAVSPEDRLAAMRAIDRDSRALLDGDLRAGQITEQRYAEFDSFF